jgi:DAK2 domain fusion protein YloV
VPAAAGPTRVLDAQGVRRWASAARALLALHRDEIDALNVYPVPDGDTGTNLLLTWDSVTGHLDEATEQPGEGLAAVMKAIARGALLGARGNSGVIVSQVLKGLAEVLSPLTSATGGQLAAALQRASEAAYAAVAEPAEGTVLTVLREAAAAAAGADPDDLPAVARAAAVRAASALAETPQQLAVLARAGVVDAGGRGLVLLLEALLRVVSGETPPQQDAPAVPALPRPHIDEHAPDGPAYEVQFLLEATDQAVAQLRAQLQPLGDSLVVTGGDGLWNVHVHVDDVGAAIEHGVEAGRPSRITVTRFSDAAARRPQRRRVGGAGRRGAPR